MISIKSYTAIKKKKDWKVKVNIRIIMQGDFSLIFLDFQLDRIRVRS